MLVELAQNAADAAQRAGVPGYLRVSIDGNELRAANTGAPGEPIFTPDPNTPSVNNLLSAGLLNKNPNFVTPNGNPFRLTRAQAATCDQDHDYTHEQAMFDLGLMDNFLQFNTSACGGLAPLQPVPNAGGPTSPRKA